MFNQTERGMKMLKLKLSAPLCSLLVAATITVAACGSRRSVGSALPGPTTAIPSPTSAIPSPTTGIPSPPTVTTPTTGSGVVVAELIGVFHQVRHIDTPNEEDRVLTISRDATYELRVLFGGKSYSESGTVKADSHEVEFIASGQTNGDFSVSHRGGQAPWMTESDFANSPVLRLRFRDGQGYGENPGEDTWFRQ
jgi:hypothetical protein